jgi:hypothetical protein
VRYLKAALIGLLGGVLVATAVLAVEVVHAQTSVAIQMANCLDNVCDGWAQVGGVEVPVAFALGFAAAFAWFLRRRRRAISV